MAKRSAVEQIVIEEKTVGEAIAKLIATREKASAWHLKWAKFEEREFLIFLFGKLAELRWIWNEALRLFFDKHQDYLKTFKDIYYEERVIEDAKKALQACEGSIAKIKKQIESAHKKGDSVKSHTLDQELHSQIGMKEHLKKKIEGHDEKMTRYKIEQVQKGLLLQAQSGLQLAEQMRHMFIAQLRIADILGTSTSDNSSTWQKMTQVLIGLSDTLGMYPPPSGAVDPLPSPSESPQQPRRSNAESPLISPGPSTPCSTNRRSFPFTFRPLPNEPTLDAMDLPPPPLHPAPPPPSYTPPLCSPNHTPTHSSHRGRAFTRCSSDITPAKIAAKPTNLSSPFPYNYRTNITILEESEKFDQPQERYRSKSVSQPRTTSSASSSPHHINNIFNLDSPVDQNYSHFNNHHRQHSNPLILGPDIPHNYDKLRGPPPPRDSETPGSGSDSGYADPIDALRQYYSSQYQGGNIPVSEPPYQTLAEIQRIRQARLNLNRTDSPEDPAYSRPFDCLRGLPGPVRISGETTPGIAMPQNFQHTNPAGRSRMKKHRVHRQPFHASSGSDDALSSSPSLSPSPEPDITPLTSSQRSGSLDRLLEPPTIQKVRVKLKEGTSCRMRQRVHSEGNLLAQKKLSSRPDILSPLALTTSTASEQDRTPSSSPQPSPIHVPIPVEVLKLHNGFAKLVHPSSSSSQSQ